MLRAALLILITLPAIAAEPKMNVVFILADDLGRGDCGCYGQQHIPTPHIDSLAKNGMRFTQHYSGAPVCAPSRCVLMTGKHLGHAEIRGNQQAKVKFPQFDEGQHPISESALTFPMLFQKAGYATGAFGKWGLGPVGSTGEPNRKGFDLFFGYNCQAVAHSYYPPHVWRNREKVAINAMPVPGHQKLPEGEVKSEQWQGASYAPKLMIAEAEKFITANASKPFFLYLPFIEPHVAMQPPAESMAKFPTEWDTEVYRGENGYTPHARPRAAYAAMVSDLDSYVGRVMAALEKAGVSERTLVIFTSDNGAVMPAGNGKANNPRFHVGGVDGKFFNSTGGLRGYKGSVHEGGLRVPMIARMPKMIAAGTVNDSACYFVDWFPTLCDAMGFTKPAGLDGESLWPTLTTGSPFKRTSPMVYVFPESGGQVAVRDGDFKTVRKGLKTKSPGSWEVYNIAKDEKEEHDLAKTPEGMKAVDRARTILKEQTSANDVFPLTVDP
jgi:arylsulfatase A-like enzyme